MHIIPNYYTFLKIFCEKNFAAGDGAVSRDQEAVRPSAIDDLDCVSAIKEAMELQVEACI